jgi:hypothetical protein
MNTETYFKILNILESIAQSRSQINFDSKSARESIAMEIASKIDEHDNMGTYNTEQLELFTNKEDVEHK